MAWRGFCCKALKKLGFLAIQHCRIIGFMENHDCSLPELAAKTLAQPPAIAQPIRHPAGRSAPHSTVLARLRMYTRRAGWGATGAGSGAGDAAGSGADAAAADLRPSPRLVAIAERSAA